MTTRCAQCDTRGVVLGNGCPLHGDLCHDCRPVSARGCRTCADPFDYDADSYERQGA